MPELSFVGLNNQKIAINIQLSESDIENLKNNITIACIGEEDGGQISVHISKSVVMEEGKVHSQNNDVAPAFDSKEGAQS